VVVSLLVAVGAVALLGDRASRPWAIAFAAVAVLALSWATGPDSLLFRIAFDVVPGFDLARASARWLVIVALVAALFAGAGGDAVWNGARRIHLAGASSSAVLVVALIAGGWLVTADRRSAVIWGITAAITLVLLAANSLASRNLRVAAVAILVLAALELGAMSMNSIPQQLRTEVAFTNMRTPTTDFLADVDAGFTVALTDDGRTADYQVPGLRPNSNALHGVPSIDGYDGGVQITQRWADALRRFQPDPATELPLRNSLTLPIEPGPLARLGVRYILLDLARPPADFIPGWVGPVAADDLFEVWENPDWLGDAVAWSSAAVSDDPAELLRNDLASVARTALVTDPSAALDCADDCDPVGLDVRRPRPERIEVSVDLDRQAVVSVAQQALPGWTLTVDDEQADVVEVDGIFLGARVPPGEHEIVFTYRSPWLTATIVLSLLAIAATISLAVADMVQSRRRAQVAGGGDR
jgi:hypothetical protein